MATSHVGWRPNVPTTSPCSPRSKMAENHRDLDKLLGQESSERLHPPAEARGASTSTTRSPQSLRGREFIVGGTIVSILWRGTTNENDLLVHQGLLNQTPRITATYADDKVKQKWRHCQRWNTSKNQRRWMKKKRNHKHESKEDSRGRKS